MRVALLCPYSWSVPGGVQNHVAGLARALRARGLEVDVLAPADRPHEPGIVQLGGTVAIPDNGSLVRVALGPRTIRAVDRAVREGGYDLVHLHEPMIPATCLTALLRTRVALVGTFHMYAASPRWYRVFRPLARRGLARLDARIAVSEAAHRHVARVCPGTYRIVPNGIDVAAHASANGHDGGPPRILFLGRPEPRKGLPVLLEAFALLDGQAALDLAGVTPQALVRAGVALPERAAGLVRVHGRVSEQERLRLLGSADILCAPSLAGESFGLVLAEAMAAGKPVVASAIRVYVDVLPPEAGRFVPPGNAGALAGALRVLLGRPELRARLGEAGRREAERFDWSRVAAEVLDVYDGALARVRR